MAVGMGDTLADTVCPYRIEQELERRYDRPMEELKAEIGWAEAHDEQRFRELMAVIDLDTAAYWDADWSHFARRGYEWAVPG